MSPYLAKLKAIDTKFFNNTPDIEPTKPSKAAFVGFDGSPMGHIIKINTAYELLAMTRLGGYSVTLNDGVLEVKEARWIDDEMADLIRTHKAELIKLLESEITA